MGNQFQGIIDEIAFFCSDTLRVSENGHFLVNSKKITFEDQPY